MTELIQLFDRLLVYTTHNILKAAPPPQAKFLEKNSQVNVCTFSREAGLHSLSLSEGWFYDLIMNSSPEEPVSQAEQLSQLR